MKMILFILLLVFDVIGVVLFYFNIFQNDINWIVIGVLSLTTLMLFGLSTSNNNLKINQRKTK